MKTDSPFFLIAGPCAVEDESTACAIAEHTKSVCERLNIDLIFKEVNPGDIVISQLPATKHLEIAKVLFREANKKLFLKLKTLKLAWRFWV